MIKDNVSDLTVKDSIVNVPIRDIPFNNLVWDAQQLLRQMTWQQRTDLCRIIKDERGIEAIFMAIDLGI